MSNEDICPRCSKETLYVFEHHIHPQTEQVICITCGWKISAAAWLYAWRAARIPYEDIVESRQLTLDRYE